MAPVRYVKPDLPANAFAGTASYYARYRVSYPESLMDDLIERAGITGAGRLLDLACGPGRIALPLAPRFRETWAIDLEPEMVEAGQQEAERRGLAGIRWIVGKAEDLEADPASFELITIGEAFHRLDQRLIGQRVLEWLSPRCCLAIVGCYGIVSGTETWQLIVADIVRKWTDRGSASSDTSAKPGRGPAHNILVLQEAGFRDVENHSFVHGHEWTLESIIGNLYSTSHCSRNVLGDRAEAFEADLVEALLAHDPGGRYQEEMRCGYTLGRRPS